MRIAMLRPVLAIAAIALLVAACSSSGSSAAPASTAPEGSTVTGGAMTVADAWARATPPGTTTSAVYAKITNGTGQDDALVSASTSAAKTVEIHEVSMMSAAPMESAGMGGMGSAAPMESAGMGGDMGGMMGMHPIDKLPIPAGATVELKPGSFHIMLIDVTNPLEDGDTIEVTLTFEKAPPITLTVPVKMG